MKTYGLDTNIISYILKNNTVIINKVQDEIIKGNIFRIPAISYYEINRGLYALKKPDKIEMFRRLCGDFGLLDITKITLDFASRIYADLKEKGELIEDADILIASSCIENDTVLVTNNENHFKRISGLTFENWV